MVNYLHIENLDKIIGLFIIIVLLFFIIRYKLIDFNKRRKQKKRFKRGAVLEEDAKQFLKDKGYKVIDDQSIHYHKFTENGKNIKAQLKVDYVVEKSGKKYLVEVKSGNSAISISNKHTRRQILEYDYVIENDGIFLLDMENREMKLIKFSSKDEKGNFKLIRFLIVFSAIGALIPFWTVKFIILSVLLIIWLYPKFFIRVISSN